jgi:hypothetical protein
MGFERLRLGVGSSVGENTNALLGGIERLLTGPGQADTAFEDAQ